MTRIEPKQFCIDVEAQFKEFGNSEFKLLLVDGDYFRDRNKRYGSTTMVMVSRNGKLSVKPEGIEQLHLK